MATYSAPARLPLQRSLAVTRTIRRASAVHRPLVRIMQPHAGRVDDQMGEQDGKLSDEPPDALNLPQCQASDPQWDETPHVLQTGEVNSSFQLPEAWDQSLDEITAKYLRADERLSQMERQLLEMIRMGSPMLSDEGSLPSPPPKGEAAAGDEQQQQQQGSEGVAVFEGDIHVAASEKGATETSCHGSGGQKLGDKQEGEGHQESREHQQQQHHPQQALLTRQSLFDVNRLQGTLTELINSGYIESIKQLRETLLIQEWDMNNRHLAKRRAVSMFERYVAERGLLNEVGGYETISGLYDDPDRLELIPDDRMKMLARSMMEECLNERKLELYQICSAQAERMASQTATASAGRILSPLRQQAWATLTKVWKFARNVLLPMGLLERGLRLLGRK